MDMYDSIMAITIVLFIVFVVGIFYWLNHSTERINREVQERRQLYDYCYQTEVEAKKVATLLMTIYSGLDEKKSDIVQIYRNNQGQLILVDHQKKTAGELPVEFSAMEMKNDNYTYHPAKTTYTGVTVGGIHTGGFHTTEAHYTQSQTSSGNGVVYCKFGDDRLVIRIKLDDKLLAEFKETPDFRHLVGKDNIATLINTYSSSGAAYTQAALSSANKYDAAAMLSRAGTSHFLPMDLCTRLAYWLNQAIRR